MNKKEAAEFLNVSEKTIERYKSAGKLSAKLKRIIGADGKSRKVLDFKEEELAELKRKMSGEIVYPTITDGHTQTKTETQTDRQTEIISVNVSNTHFLIHEQTQTLKKLLETFEQSKTKDKILLTVKDIQFLTGLSDKFIRAEINAERLKGKKIGNGFKVKRADLDKFIENLI